MGMCACLRARLLVSAGVCVRVCVLQRISSVQNFERGDGQETRKDLVTELNIAGRDTTVMNGHVCLLACETASVCGRLCGVGDVDVCVWVT